MRLLTGAIIALAVLWGAYWFIGARALDHAVTVGLAGLPDQGITAGFSDVSVRGFPNRFDLTVSDLALGSAGVVWRAPFVQALALSYKPHHLIAVWPARQVLETAAGDVVLESGKMQGSVVLRPEASLQLDHATVIVDQGRLVSIGWEVGFAQGRIAVRALGDDWYRLGVEVTDLVSGASVRAVLDPAGALPTTGARLYLDADLTLDRPLNRFAVANGGPGLVALKLTDARLVWGDMTLAATGTLEFDAAGSAQGTLRLTLADWRQALPVLIALTGLSATQQAAVAAEAARSGDPDRVTLALVFADGAVTLAGVALPP